MTPLEFIKKVRAGTVEVRSGHYDAQAEAMVETMAPLTLDDVEGVTAEAMNAGVQFQSDDWDKMVAEITQAIAEDKAFAQMVQVMSERLPPVS